MEVPSPLDETRAAALAKRNVCGAPGSDGEGACVVESVLRRGSDYEVLIERNPPAGVVFVYIANESMATFAMRYGPAAL